jgi:hypothetical protein
MTYDISIILWCLGLRHFGMGIERGLVAIEHIELGNALGIMNL